MKYILVIFWCSVLCQAWGREVISLNQCWKFTPGYETSKNTYTEVNLPHTWNQDALAAKVNYERGLGNYEKDIDIPAAWQGKRIYLRFKGANTITNVFINGKHAGEHRGGYTAFAIDVTPYIQWGEKNTIWVRVNNSPQLDIMPLLGDFNMYGGIYRDVELIITESFHISLSDFGSYGVYFTQTNVSREKAEILAKILVKGKAGCSSVIRVKIEDPQGKNIVTEEQEITFNEQGEAIGKLLLTLKKPHLWKGRKDPFLYQTVTELFHKGQMTDRVNEKIGIRYFRVDPDKGFFLNDEYLSLRGVCRHQDRAEIGNALLPFHHREDMEIMKEMGVNAVRLAHYPQDRYIYDLCDEYGFIVWAEIPFVGPGGYRDKGFVDQASFRENGKIQLKELIRQNYNHPSICFWGLFNELKQAGDDPLHYIEELNALAHQEDPSRLTTAASNQKGALNEVTDLIAWNQYYGWYGGDPAGIGKWADAIHKKYPQKPVGISEYGAGGSILHQQEELKKPVANSYWHPENWQTFFHEEHWKAIAQRPYLWGTFVWNMFDFGAAHRQEGEIAGKNDKGLVTFDRKTKKDAFYFYKANWNLEEPFVYITEKRLEKRSEMPRQIKIYSNQPEVELLLNGKSLGVKKGTYGIFIWSEILLKKGENILTARSKNGITDELKILF